MPKIIIENLNKFEIVFHNTEKSILNNFGEAYQDWMQACGGKGRCVTCRAIILEGMENLSELTAPELKFRLEHKLKPNERLCCQTKLLKNEVVVSVPDSCKLPHLKYSF